MYINLIGFVDDVCCFFGVEENQFATLSELSIDVEELKEYLYGRYDDSTINASNIASIDYNDTLYDIYNSIMK